MRARLVNFQRGLDPKEALDLGNKNLRKFRKDLQSGNYTEPLNILIDGLENGYISDEETDEFLTGGIINNARIDYYWPGFFRDTKNIYWSKGNESLNINFVLPDFKRIKTWIGKMYLKPGAQINFKDSDYYYKMRTSSTDKSGKGYGISEENTFEKDDYAFTVKFIISQINKVYKATLINIE
jgi:hypothetical protein